MKCSCLRGGHLFPIWTPKSQKQITKTPIKYIQIRRSFQTQLTRQWTRTGSSYSIGSFVIINIQRWSVIYQIRFVSSYFPLGALSERF